LEAVAAVHRFIAARIERDLGYAAALAAGRLEHFTRTATAAAAAFAAAGVAGAHGLARLTAIRTTVRLVLKAFLLVKTLFARTEDELASAVDTVEHFIYVHETRAP
jgi:hypothetical protein